MLLASGDQPDPSRTADRARDRGLRITAYPGPPFQHSLPLHAVKFNDSAGEPPVLSCHSMDQSELHSPASVGECGLPMRRKEM